jgi:hypothetical protein
LQERLLHQLLRAIHHAPSVRSKHPEYCDRRHIDDSLTMLTRPKMHPDATVAREPGASAACYFDAALSRHNSDIMIGAVQLKPCQIKALCKAMTWIQHSQK